MGDGVLAYFGYPRRIGRAERCSGWARSRRCRRRFETTGLVNYNAESALPPGRRLLGSGAWEQAVVGETPNLAARLQSLTEPGRVVVA
jgi:class 3 adenylate cyclase